MLGFWWTAKHDSAGLAEVLRERFGETKIGDLKHRVLVPAVNYSTGLGQFFKTPHHSSFELDHRMSVVEVALATAAAPVYFPCPAITAACSQTVAWSAMPQACSGYTR